MTLEEFLDVCPFEVLTLIDKSAQVTAGYTSDLLSDVMAHCPEESILITVQNHKNTVAVATLAGCKAILVCHDRETPQDMIDAAGAEDIAVFKTPLNQFEASYMVAKALSI